LDFGGERGRICTAGAVASGNRRMLDISRAAGIDCFPAPAGGEDVAP